MASPDPLPDLSAQRDRATLLLKAVCAGKDDAAADLVPVLYGTLKRIAGSLLDNERADHTLQATALVHEAWLRLVDVDDLDPESSDEARRRFVSLAARTMRNVLIDHARKKNAGKREGRRQRITLTETLPQLAAMDGALLDLEDALSKLAERNERLAQVAELRLFGGLSLAELAPVVGVSLTRVKEDWAFARAMLAKMLDEHQD